MFLQNIRNHSPSEFHNQAQQNPQLHCRENLTNCNLIFIQNLVRLYELVHLLFTGTCLFLKLLHRPS